MPTHRPAVLTDLPQIVAIYNATIPSCQVTADLEPVSVDSRLPWFHAHQGNRPLWVVEQVGQVVAWLSISDFYGRPAYAKTAEISLYVDESMRCQGLGTYLLSEAISHAPQLQIDRLLAFIFSHNTPSLNLFEKLGFEPWGLFPEVALINDIKRDLTILGCKI